MADARLARVIEPATLMQHLDDPGLCLVFVGDAERYAAGHPPGASRIDYRDLNAERPPAGGLLPDTETLARVLGAAGITPECHVIAFDAEGNGRASRLLWTLDCIGHHRWSLLDGGIIAWHAEGHPLVHGPDHPDPAPAYPVRHIDDMARAKRDEVLAHLDDPETTLLDARSPAEYTGDDVRAARGGHIPGAVNVEWTLNVDPARHTRLRPREALQRLYREAGVRPEQTVITHCQTHHRSALTYVVLRHLGFVRVRGYDGSWSEWGNDPEVPVVTGPDPK